MKALFPEYYPPTEQEFETLWREARVVVDANVLLNLYLWSDSTRNDLMKLLGAVSTRLWVPYQFAKEFQENRVEKILQQEASYEDALKTMATTVERLQSRKKHPIVSQATISALEQSCAELRAGAEAQRALLRSDSIFARISEIFDDRVGPPPSLKTLDEWQIMGRERFEKKIPPGWKDKDKPEPRRYGDLIGWLQILDFAREKDVSIIFVTHETKEDWWEFGDKHRLGPRLELLREFGSGASRRFHMYSPDEFVRWGAEQLDQDILGSTIDEVRERQDDLVPTVSTGKARKSVIASTGEEPKATRPVDDRAEVSQPELRPRDELPKNQSTVEAEE